MKRVQFLTASALLAAVVCLTTTFLRLPVPLAQGYVHLGDVAIFLGALWLGRKSAAAAGVGSALADLMSGFALYAPATFVIKGLMGFAAGSFAGLDKPVWRSALAFGLCGLMMALGYFAFEWPVFGWAVAVADLPPNLMQGLVSAALAVMLLPLARRVDRALPGGRP